MPLSLPPLTLGTRTYQPRRLSNERSIEVPVAARFLELYPHELLEVGNLMWQYEGYQDDRDVVDLYDHSAWVMKGDIMSFTPVRTYKAFLSVSTLEHVYSPETALRLAWSFPNALITLPVNFGVPSNLGIRWWPGEKYYVVRTTRIHWRLADETEAFAASYGKPCLGANAVAFLVKGIWQ